MLFGNRKPRSSVARRRGEYRPVVNHLEDRVLLAGSSIDLSNIASNPYGVEFLGSSPGNNHSGFSVSYVGDTNGDKFDDLLVGNATSGSGDAQAYLIFGSLTTAGTNVSWAGLTAAQRLASLTLLGTTGQPNGFDFNGVKFTASSLTGTALTNVTVTGVGNLGNGLNDFMIGFPNADGGAGRVYLVYGSAALTTLAGTTLDLDTTALPTGVNVVKFAYSNPAAWPNAHAGRAMATQGNIFGDNGDAIAIGAPDVSNYNVLEGGAVYTIQGGQLATPQTGTFFIDQIGQSGGLNGVVFAGSITGGTAGASIAGAGSFDGAATSDFLIGAPSAPIGSGPLVPGTAYLIYGATNLGTFTQTVAGFSVVPLSVVGAPATGVLPGASFKGTGTDQTGFSVSSAGDFNNDGVADIMIGSPSATVGSAANEGLVTLIYGVKATSTGTGRITGTIPLSAIPSSINSVQFAGPGASAFAGWSISPVGKMNNSGFNEILIGAPGFLNNAGAAFLIPGQAALFGTQQLSNATADPIDATLITSSTPPGPTGTTMNNFGYSVSGRLTPAGQGNTLDADSIADFVIGAPGISPTGTSVTSPGVAFALEGRFVPLAVPVSQVIPVSIDVNSVTPPFLINLVNQTTVQIAVLSRNTVAPNFHPLTDINPASIVVNGVTIPNVTLQLPLTANFPGATSNDLDGDGINDAIITVPLSALGLTNGTQTITIQGKTLATATDVPPNSLFQGSASVQVSGGTSGGGGGPVAPLPNPFFNLNFPNLTNAIPPLGERLVPTIASLSKLTWKPLPIAVAFNQFDPKKPFAFRYNNFFHPVRVHPSGSRLRESGSRTSTLGREVFTRSVFHTNKTVRFTHPGTVIPARLQTEGTLALATRAPRRKG
jgi:hypothetical protein